jgi:uncharacterized membrane protein YgcG
MARRDTGKWVQRAAATGGSRAYRGQRPVKWYTSLVLIAILGVALVWYSRYEKENPSAATQPAVGTQWFDAFAVDICGTVEPNLPANPPVKKGPGLGLTTAGDGVIHIDPKTSAEAGDNATLGRFVQDYPGLVLTSSSIRYPGQRSAGPTVDRTFKNGEVCPKGTKDAGKAGQVEVDLWPTPTSTSPERLADPTGYKLGDEQELTLAFVPAGAKVPRPSGSAVTAMLQDASAAASGSSPTSTPTSSTPTSSGTASSGSSGTGSSGTGSNSAGSSSAGSSGSSGSAASSRSKASSSSS